ncbi:energy transducer TonB [Bacteroides sp. 519]|uniref:energy transducer TonB n=1 Tax=Bacteroides sp. 519 TaxID=2302937 RepID=UPI0013D32F3B|nr:energy transducer TonB [Bacteroides sp. 519]
MIGSSLLLLVPPLHAQEKKEVGVEKNPLCNGEQVYTEPDTLIYGNDTTVHYVVEKMPEFPGGTVGLFKHIFSNLKYPTDMQEGCWQGRVIIQFIIEKDGSISEATVIRSLHESFDREALRVINIMPKWIPGSQEGELKRVKYVIPISFRC